MGNGKGGAGDVVVLTAGGSGSLNVHSQLWPLAVMNERNLGNDVGFGLFGCWVLSIMSRPKQLLGDQAKLTRFSSDCALVFSALIVS